MQRNQPLEIVSKLNAMLGLAPGKGVPRKIVGVAKMIDTAQQRAEHLAVIGDAADRSPAEIDAVIGALAGRGPTRVDFVDVDRRR